MSDPDDFRDVLAEIFETGFQHAEEGRPYDYADEIIRRMEMAGWIFSDLRAEEMVGRVEELAEQWEGKGRYGSTSYEKEMAHRLRLALRGFS